MKILVLLFSIFYLPLAICATDYDVAIVGTTPICMLEALHHAAKGERVLLIESEPECGGAWKTISVCGIPHVDMGCHQIGSRKETQQFFRECIGIDFVCLDHPDQLAVGAHAHCPSGHYFRRGCHELISTLLERIREWENLDLVHTSLESAHFHPRQGYVELKMCGQVVNVKKLMATHGAHFQVLNFAEGDFIPSRYHFYHLYLLVEDRLPPSFVFKGGEISGTKRVMNLTYFLDEIPQNQQLIVIQVNGPANLEEAQFFLESLQSASLLSPDAKILCSDTHTYHQAYLDLERLRLVAGSLLQIIDAKAFWTIPFLLPQWTQFIPKLCP